MPSDGFEETETDDELQVVQEEEYYEGDDAPYNSVGSPIRYRPENVLGQ